MRIYRHVTANGLYLKRFPFQRELSMEAYLIENENVLELDDKIFKDVEIVEAELAVAEGRPSRDSDGRIDILATYAAEYIAVVELKLGELTDIHLKQLEDYLAKRNHVLEKYSETLGPQIVVNPKWIGVLAGSSISPDLAQKLRQGYFAEGDIPVAALIIQRFRGEDGTVLVTTDTCFGRPSNVKDSTLYDFEGETLNKGRLALALIKRHVETHPAITYAELENDFPKSCQGPAGVFTDASHATNIYISTKKKRHFVNTEDLIELKECKIAVSNQWGKDNILTLIKRARTLGYKVSEAADDFAMTTTTIFVQET